MALDELYLVIATRLDSIDKKLDAIGNMKELVETALAALSVESQNAAAIVVLTHRVSLLESRLNMKPPATAAPQ